MKKLNKKGFTIVELVIVIAVIAILAAVLIPTFSGVVEKANQSAAQQQAASAEKIALSMSANATLPDRTGIVIYKDNTATYFFEYKNNKLTDVEKTDIVDVHSKAGYTTTLGSIIVSNEYFLASGADTITAVSSWTEATTDVANLFAKLVDISGTCGTTGTFTATTPDNKTFYKLVRNDDKTGYVLSIFNTAATTTPEPVATYTINVYTSVDITKDCVIIVPTYTKSAS